MWTDSGATYSLAISSRIEKDDRFFVLRSRFALFWLSSDRRRLRDRRDEDERLLFLLPSAEPDRERRERDNLLDPSSRLLLDRRLPVRLLLGRLLSAVPLVFLRRK